MDVEQPDPGTVNPRRARRTVARLRRWASKWPKETSHFWLALVLSVLVSVAIERNWDDLAGGSGGAAGRAVFSAGAMYQQLLTAGPRTTAPRYTAIVDIARNVEPDDVTLNICSQRQFIAKLIGAVATAHPSVIVIDKYFGPTTCTKTPAGTDALRQAIADAIRGGTPVVVGRYLDRNSLEVSRALSLRMGDSAPIEGFINLHQDNRRLSFRWAGKVSNEWFELPTLSVAAAQAHRADLMDDPRFRRIYESRRYPYVSFLSQEQFGSYRMSAIDTLCGPGRRDSDWMDCRGDKALVNRLHGRVVLLGDNTPELDHHASVIGTVPGILLQANYVEALLDERVFDELPQWLELLFGIVIAIVIEYVLVSSTGPVQLIRRLVIVGLLAIGASYATVLFLGRYVNPWSVSVIALLLKSVSRVPEWIRAQGGRRRSARASV